MKRLNGLPHHWMGVGVVFETKVYEKEEEFCEPVLNAHLRGLLLGVSLVHMSCGSPSSQGRLS